MLKQNLPEGILTEFKKAAALHQRAVSDYAKCLEFNQIMANLFTTLEDSENYKLADKIMSILIECAPKEGSHCEKATQIENRMKTLIR
jgi:hypothetical protein